MAVLRSMLELALQPVEHLGPVNVRVMAPLVRVVGLVAMLGLCVVSLASGTHNPFMYFRF